VRIVSGVRSEGEIGKSWSVPSREVIGRRERSTERSKFVEIRIVVLIVVNVVIGISI
jgi:hypothetical protein